MDKNGNVVYEITELDDPQALAMKKDLIGKVGAMRFPTSPIDQIISEFGPDAVAEITGRKRRIIKYKNQPAREEKRSAKQKEVEVDEFNEGKCRILVFSDFGGTGRSFHADLTYKNRQRRVHYVLQPGWRADKTLQGMGRTHRTNEAAPPMYVLVTTNLKGQMRFVSSVARRLDQLGALTKGQRQAGSQGLFVARDNLESPYAKEALLNFYRAVYNGSIPGIDIQTLEKQTGLKLTDQNGRLLHELPPMERFLNRILSMEIETQNTTFEAFSNIFDAVLRAAVVETIITGKGQPAPNSLIADWDGLLLWQPGQRSYVELNHKGIICLIEKRGIISEPFAHHFKNANPARQFGYIVNELITHSYPTRSVLLANAKTRCVPIGTCENFVGFGRE